jgi:hypothetical protein
MDDEGICLGAGLVAKVAAIMERLEVAGLAETVQIHGLVGERSNRRNANIHRNGKEATAARASSDLRVVEDGPIFQGERRHRHREEEEEDRELHGAAFAQKMGCVDWEWRKSRTGEKKEL